MSWKAYISDVNVEVLRRAAEILGGKGALREVLRVSLRQLDRWMLGTERPPSYVFLKLVDIVAERPTTAASETVRQSIQLRRKAKLVNQAAVEARLRADKVLKASLARSKEIRAGLLKEAAMLMRSDAASLQVLDAKKDELLLLGWTGFHPNSASYWQRVAVGNESTCGAALKERQRVIVADVNDPNYALTREGIACYELSGLVAVQSTPLVSRGGHLLGMISTHWRRVHQPAERDLARFDVLARRAADALESTRL